MSVAMLEAAFTDPARTFSPTPFWWWSGEPLTRERLRWQLERFVEGGVFNLVVLNLAPTGPHHGSDPDQPAFFSDAWWVLFKGVCQDARELGVHLWFYDQIGFSGANLQGEIVGAQPEFAGQSLERISRIVSGPAELHCPPGGEPLAAEATPVDEHGVPVANGILLSIEQRGVRWSSPQNYRLTLFYSVERGFDYFSPAACQRLIDTVHGAYELQVGSYFGDTIVGSFQDELPAMPTWSRAFAERFEQRYGYDLLSKLSALWEDHGEESERVRFDYHATRAALCEEAFFRPLFEWHEARGLICGCDQQRLARAGHPTEAVKLYADYQRTHRWFSAPGCDHHGEAKIHSSLAHLYGRPRTWIEAFHSTGWGGTLEETFDWLLPWLRAGANLYNPHAVYYSTRGGWWEWAPPATDWRQPYWKHHAFFSQTIARLCSVLTQGHHVCGVGMLFPNATIQSGLGRGEPTAFARQAHATYLQLVGSMRWYQLEVGIMDRAGTDYDVLDDDSVQRARAAEGCLCIGQETYHTVILPGCTILEEATATKLREFVDGGGTLIVVGKPPCRAAGTGGQDEEVAALASAIAAHSCPQVDTPEALLEVLANIPKLVEAPVPTLVRRVGETTVVFVPATFPRASELVADPNSDPAWLRFNTDYEFSPSSYPESLSVKVFGVSGSPELWEPFSGRRCRLAGREDESGVTVEVPFTDAPCALLVWQEMGDSEMKLEPAAWTIRSEILLDDVWKVELDPTLDNRWGDFALPPHTGSPPAQCWKFKHKRASPGEDRVSEGWHRGNFDDTGWSHVYATFGPHGIWLGPVAAELLPSTLGRSTDWNERLDGTDSGPWRNASYSLSRGIFKDPIHLRTLGPKGHVPEEFLDFGRAAPGEAIHFRTVVFVDTPLEASFALGAPADKRAWLNGREVMGDERGYLSTVPVSLIAGANLLEFQLTAEEAVELRAYFAFVRHPMRFERPEWLAPRGEPERDSIITFTRTVELPLATQQAVIQLAADAPCRFHINGEEVGRQGGFDPYIDVKKVIRAHLYDMTSYLVVGENTLVIEVADRGVDTAVLVDGWFAMKDRALPLISDETWQVVRDGAPCSLNLKRVPVGDSASLQDRRRPHPLPQTSWLEQQESDGTVVDIVPSASWPQHHEEWLRFSIPPGAHHMRLQIYGTVAVYLDGECIEPDSSAQVDRYRDLEFEFPHSEALERTCALRVITMPGFEEGGILHAPAQFTLSVGRMRLGSWEQRGLPAYSGGVAYYQNVEWNPAGVAQDSRIFLDLGQVRGTAEVHVNQKRVGVRLWSPYLFDISAFLKEGKNELRLSIYNTLGPYLDAISPTRSVFGKQRSSGLMGPVKITVKDPVWRYGAL